MMMSMMLLCKRARRWSLSTGTIGHRCHHANNATTTTTNNANTASDNDTNALAAGNVATANFALNSSSINGGGTVCVSLSSKFPISMLINIDPDICRLKSFKKSTRKVILPKHIANANINMVRNLINVSFPELEDEKYLLGYSIPQHSKKGNAGNATYVKPVLEDCHIYNALCEAKESVLPVHIHVRSNPGIFPPIKSEEDAYLIDMPSPDNLESYTMLSFYKFKEIQNPSNLIADLRSFLMPFGALGRIYVANEGINAQMAVPTNVLPYFQSACNKSKIFKSSFTSATSDDQDEDLFLNIDHAVTKEDFMINKPFSGLKITHREQIVSDGKVISVNWSDRGNELSPLEWHDAIENADKTNAIIIDCRNSYESDVGKFKNAIPLNTLFFRESWDALDEILSSKPKDTPVLTYCTGGIRCVKVNAFLKQNKGFQNVSSLKGGIINYVKEIQKLDESNSHNRSSSSGSSSDSDSDSSIDSNSSSVYNTLTMDHRHVEKSKFMGINYVFDDRMGSRITKDHLAVCETCGTCKCDSFCNCLNPTCHIKFIQCRSCSTKYGGCCSKYCQTELEKYVNLKLQKEEENRRIREHNMLVKANRVKGLPLLKYSNNSLNALVNNNLTVSREFSSIATTATTKSAIGAATTTTAISSNMHSNRRSGVNIVKPSHALDGGNNLVFSYAEKYSSDLPKILLELYKKTVAIYSKDTAERLCSSELQGRLLSSIASIKQPRSVLELGTFTGFGTLSLLYGMSMNKRMNEGEEGKILTCEIDERAHKIASEAFKNVKSLSLSSSSSSSGSLANVSIESHLKSASDMIKWARDHNLEFDMVYIDCDKKNYKQYLVDLLDSSLLNENAVILVDNTLWKGLVLEFDDQLLNQLAENSSTSNCNSDSSSSERVVPEVKANDRYMKIAKHMHEFNVFVKECKELSQVILPIRDGISIISYNSSLTSSSSSSSSSSRSSS